MSFGTENVDVEDKVICYSATTEDAIGIIKRKTPKGFIDVDFGKYTVRFDKLGREKNGSGCTRKRLKYYTEKEGKEIERQRMKMDFLCRIKRCRIEDFNLESIEKIWKICREEMEGKD